MRPNSDPNTDLFADEGDRPYWNRAKTRRNGFHTLHRLARQVTSYRAERVLALRSLPDNGLAQGEDVRALTRLSPFSALVVTEGDRVLFEAYAPDFGPDRPHAIMSISKMALNLAVGRLVDEGRIRLDEPIGAILPWIGPGYRTASVLDVLNMNVRNGYCRSADVDDPCAIRHEGAAGLRLPEGAGETLREMVGTIDLDAGCRDTINRTKQCLYKSANSEVLGFVLEARRGRPAGQWLADLADAAGFEGALHCLTDRTGFPLWSGGFCLTARDLCRFGAIFVRKARGLNGQEIGSEVFIAETLAGGVPMPPPRESLRYSRHTNTNGAWLGHGGFGGQYMVANPTTGRVAAFLSVLETEDGNDESYYPPIIRMLGDICSGDRL